MKGQGTGGGKNDTSSGMLWFSIGWRNFDFCGCLDCWKTHSILFCIIYSLPLVSSYPPGKNQKTSSFLFPYTGYRKILVKESFYKEIIGLSLTPLNPHHHASWGKKETSGMKNEMD